MLINSGGDSGLVLKTTERTEYLIDEVAGIWVRRPGTAGTARGIELSNLLINDNPDVKEVIGVNTNKLPIAFWVSNNGIDKPLLLNYGPKPAIELAPIKPDPAIDPSNRIPAYTLKDTAYAFRVAVNNIPVYLIAPFEVVETYIAHTEVIS